MFVRVLLLLCVTLSGVGCAQRAPLMTAQFEDSLRAPYRLGSGDRLRIIIFGQNNLSNIYTVDPSGRIAFPLVGAVAVQNMTARDVEQALAAQLRAGYLRDPKVTVEVDTHRPFFILGEVTTAGQYQFVNGMTVQTAAAIAGGFTPRANQHYAEITRTVNGQTLIGSVPLTHPIRPGDTVVIKERWL
jgi:polysaccharide biosynthesis/export protein